MTRARTTTTRRRSRRRATPDPISRLAEVGYVERRPQDWVAIERAKRQATPDADHEQLMAEAKRLFDGETQPAPGGGQVRRDGTSRREKYQAKAVTPAPPKERKKRTGATQNRCRCGQPKPVAAACCTACRPSWPCKNNCGNPIGDMPVGRECRHCNNVRRRVA